MVTHAKCGTILTSTAMHSLLDSSVYFGPKAQWRHLRDNGCVSDIFCFTEDSKILGSDFVFATKNSTISHKFCFGLVTGLCHYQGKNGGKNSDCQERIANARNVLKEICLDHRVEVPL